MLIFLRNGTLRHVFFAFQISSLISTNKTSYESSKMPTTSLKRLEKFKFTHPKNGLARSHMTQVVPMVYWQLPRREETSSRPGEILSFDHTHTLAQNSFHTCIFKKKRRCIPKCTIWCHPFRCTNHTSHLMVGLLDYFPIKEQVCRLRLNYFPYTPLIIAVVLVCTWLNTVTLLYSGVLDFLLSPMCSGATAKRRSGNDDVLPR
jgi:hypothetical protein